MAFRFDRFLVIALILTSAAVAVSAEDDDVDRTDYSDPALSEDGACARSKMAVHGFHTASHADRCCTRCVSVSAVKLEATGPHSDIETAWILPEAADNSMPPPAFESGPTEQLPLSPHAPR